MKLMYLWVDDAKRFRDFHVNFDSAFEFKFDSCSCSLSYSKGKSELPEGFFNYRADRACISDVSVLVGANASGKTSVARFLQQVRANDDSTASFNYVLVYELSSRWHVQWCVRTDPDEDVFRDVKLMSPPEEFGDWCDCKPNSPKNMAKCDFEFAYYSPHFTTESPFPAHCAEMDNLSSNGIMYGGFEEQMNRSYDISDHPGIQMNYLASEHRRGLAVLRHVPKAKDDGIDLPGPNGVYVDIHRVEFNENRHWLENQWTVLLQQRKALLEKNPQDGLIKWYDDKINDVDILRSAIDYYRRPDRDSRFNFVARAYVAFMLSYVRLAGYFRREYDPLYVSYAGRLILIYKDVVEKFILACDCDARCFYANLIRALHRNVVIYERQVGNPVERKSDHRERIAVARIFMRLARWCLETHPENWQGFVDRLYLEGKQLDKLGWFFDAYSVAMRRFDFLSFSYDPVLSSGEMSVLSLYGRLYDFVVRMDESRRLREQYSRMGMEAEISAALARRSFAREVVVFLDEAETTMHPEWQRQIVANVIRFFEIVAPEYRIHLVFATHSPMILSDIPSGNVMFLNGDVSAADYERARLGLNNTFGANVLDLYRLGFFLKDGAVGAFAAGKIKRMISNLADAGPLDDDAHFIVEQVGDPMVRSYLKGLERNRRFLCRGRSDASTFA